jgi:hypothetical protein
MKRFSILAHMLVLALILSACGAGAAPQTTPTLDPVDQAIALQATIMAAGFTSVAQTQTALPTFTPLPPTATFTNTPDVTATLPVMPTLGATFTAVAGSNSGAVDPCINTVLPGSLEGDKIRMRIDNPTRATINVTVYLLQASPGAVCGYRAYTLDPAGSLVISDLPVGCYTIWAWNPDPDDYFMVTNGSNCLDTSNTWAFDVSTNRINLRP